MVVVADATPLHYLVLIDEIDLLRALYGAILIPNAVVSELSHPKTPAKIRAWMTSLPPWASVVLPRSFDLPFAELGQGEREAIAIASKAPASIPLTDDHEARKASASLKVQTVPTIRVLSTAGELGLVDFPDALRRLQLTNVGIAPKLIPGLLAQRPLE